MDYSTVAEMVASSAAIRRRRKLQPAGGKGDKIYPPTYPEERRGQGPRHVFERRRIGDREAWCVLLDSVQSQANRLEDALLTALRQGAIELPYVTVDFRDSGLAGLSEITSLEAPHRVYDAILRDSLLDGKPFMKSPLGLRLAEAKPHDATALLEASPNALLFGAWHSTGGGGGLGAKFPRCLVSEIVAIDVPVDHVAENEVRTASRRTGSRIDPLGVLRKVEVFKSAEGWDVTKEKAGKGAKAARPSEINHGNIAPTVQPLGITCDHAEHVAVLSFAGLRRLGFGGGAKDVAGHALLAALGIVALVEQDACGYALRSRCDLVCDGLAPFELVRQDGTVTPFDIDRTTARTLYAEALKAARDAGLTLPSSPVRLTPQDKLVDIVRRSQTLALEGEGGDADAT